MEIEINVVNQRLRVATDLRIYAPWSENFVKFRFNLDSAWDGLLTFAQFAQAGDSFNVYLDEDNCVYLPPDIQPGLCNLVLYGTNGTGVIGTTNKLELKIDDNMLVIDTHSIGITPTLYEQLVALILNVATPTETATYLGIPTS